MRIPPILALPNHWSVFPYLSLNQTAVSSFLYGSQMTTTSFADYLRKQVLCRRTMIAVLQQKPHLRILLRARFKTQHLRPPIMWFVSMLSTSLQNIHSGFLLQSFAVCPLNPHFLHRYDLTLGFVHILAIWPNSQLKPIPHIKHGFTFIFSLNRNITHPIRTSATSSALRPSSIVKIILLICLPL